MDTKKKQLIFIGGSIFVAIIFLTSYAAFSNNNSASTTTSTIKNRVTYFALGSSNAIITNYSDVALITFSGNAQAQKATVANVLSELAANGSIGTYYANSNIGYNVSLTTISPYALQQLLYNKTGGNSINVGSTAYITLPKSITLYYSSTPVPIYLSNTNYTVYMGDVRKVGTVINVSISALLTNNGAVYNNQLRIGYSGVAPATVPSNTVSNALTYNTQSSNSLPSKAVPANSTASNSIG